MRILRSMVIVLFTITLIAFTFIFIREKLTEDKTIPKITVKGEIIDVSLKATDKELLQGISAYDEKDGDLTGDIIIESVSRFIETGVSKVTYAVCDSDNNITTATRKTPEGIYLREFCGAGLLTQEAKMHFCPLGRKCSLNSCEFSSTP